MSEALRQSLGNYCNNSTSDWTIGGANYAVAALIDNVSYDGQQVIYIFDKTRVKVDTQRLRVKKCNTQRLPLIK